MNIQKKLAIFAATSLLPLLAVSISATLTINKLHPEKSALQVMSVALSNHMESDMMHDALRADVLAGLLADSPEALRRLSPRSLSIATTSGLC